MDSMEDLVKKLGWIPWILTGIALFTPIITWLVNNKLSVYLEFDASTKLNELRTHTIPGLKKMLSVVEEKMVLAAAEDNVSQSNLKTLDLMMMNLKSALYEAEDILGLLDYRRIEKGIYLGEDGNSRWVEHKLNAACAWIARCKASWFGTAVMKLFCICRAIKIAGAAVRQCVQSWYQQLLQLFRCLILRRSGPAPPPPSLDLESRGRGSEFVQADPARRPADEMVVDVKETVVEEAQAEEKQVEGEMPKEIEEGCEGGQEGEISANKEIKAESTEGEVGETLSVEDLKEFRKVEERKKGKPTSMSGFLKKMSILCARSMLTWYAAYFYRDEPQSQEDGSAAELLTFTERRISLRNQIKRIEDILIASKKSDLLSDKHSSSGTAQNADKESSSSTCTVKNSAEESISTQKQIDDVHRRIEKKVFGRDKDRDHISRMLREGPADAYAASSCTSISYSAIGIYGIKGSGKSTLAKYVCDYEKGIGHFSLIMFILVGKTFSICDLFREMLDQINLQCPSDTNGSTSLRTELKDLKSLKAELTEKLKDRRFLLVLDDLWVNDENQMGREILLDTLNVAMSGSKILVTAQKKDAAQALGAQKQILIPELEEEVYVSLFMHHARPHAAGDGVEFEQVGRKIANRLYKSPIAAETVGRQLQRNKSISFWQATASLDVLNKTMGALLWSYQQLGEDIRRCFAYCSTFPKGYRLKRDELVRIWIAQGFVSTRSNAAEDLEDIGQSYFHQLLTFSFLQTQGEVFSFKNGYAEEFTIHDLLHELAEKVSGSEFFRIGVNGSPEDIPLRVHHLFVETKNLAEINEKILYLGNLRTMIINEDSYDYYSDPKSTVVERNLDLERLLERLFMRLKKLRVLIIEVDSYTGQLSVPASIDHIKHLRYLALPSRVFCLILPSTFSKLYQIQTIDIPCQRASCPKDMANLVHLRHISAPLYFPNIGRLTSLQTLASFKVKVEQGYELNQLKHLNKLGGNLRIDGLGIVKRKEEAIEANLVQKEGLRKLKLEFGWRNGPGPDVEAEVLEGLCPPMHLKKLSIKNYRGSRYPSWMLSRHHSEAAPKHLQKLELSGCSQLAYIPEDSELFIGLRELSIKFCDWDRLPQNMERLVSLQTLKILGCREMELFGTLPHQSLKEIKIWQYNGLRYPSWMLSRHHSEAAPKHLQKLVLGGCSQLAYIPEDNELFIGLRELDIMSCDWDSLPQNMERLVSLQTLKICNCEEMKLLPTLPHQSLEEINIIGCGELSKTCKEEGHENWRKIQHIPNKFIW